MTVSDDWTTQLASAIAAAIREFRPLLGNEPIACLDIGCFPWHGSIELSALTVAELDADSAVLGPQEIASWRYYNFSNELASWVKAAVLGQRMSQAYYTAEDDIRAATAEAYMQGCATAVVSPEVKDAVDSLPRDPRFRIRVAHPDSGRNFMPPESHK